MKTITNVHGTQIEIPDASNTKSAITNFKERRSLTELVVDNDLFDSTMDLRVQKHLYGRVDTQNNAIYPDISQVSFNPTSYVFGFDFINKLINEFNADWESLVPSNLSPTSIYQDIQIENKDYRNIEETFRDYYHELFTEHREILFLSGDSIKVSDFDSFVVNFAEFLSRQNIPFTRECLIRSAKYKPQNTLLIYNFQKQDHGNDEETFQTFYLDSGIYLIASALLQYGFVLDRHSPWRFAVNLKSPPVISSKGSGVSSILREYYIKAYTTEVDNVTDLLVTYYNNFVEQAQHKKIKEVFSTQYDAFLPVQCKIDRKLVNESDDLKLSIINFLINVRLGETGQNLSFQQKQSILNAGLGGYEKLHSLLKGKIKLRLRTNMSRPEALYVANHVGCRGATFVKEVGWVPCQKQEDFANLLTMPSGFFKDAKSQESLQHLHELILDKLET